MATWQAEAEPNDDTSVTLTLSGKPEEVQLPSNGEPQLVVMVFTIAAAEHPEKQGLLVSGQLHIRTPPNENCNDHDQKRVTRLALQALEKRAETVSSGASQLTAPVIVLTGDVNLPKWFCDPLVQEYGGRQSVQTQWQVMTSNAELSGDVLFIKGAFGEALYVSVGASYPADASFVW